ncbi:MAG: hypothetical protein KBF78_08080 [Fuscovulum sp.]|nr:hypothetical protein [Fuscovulum sp.]
MNRALLLPLTLPLAACVAGAAPAPQAAAARPDVAALLQPAGAGVRVARTVAPAYAMWDGAAARHDADALCGPQGVQASIYDRYDAGAWVFVRGCA